MPSLLTQVDNSYGIETLMGYNNYHIAFHPAITYYEERRLPHLYVLFSCQKVMTNFEWDNDLVLGGNAC